MTFAGRTLSASQHKRGASIARQAASVPSVLPIPSRIMSSSYHTDTTQPSSDRHINLIGVKCMCAPQTELQALEESLSREAAVAPRERDPSRSGKAARAAGHAGSPAAEQHLEGDGAKPRRTVRFTESTRQGDTPQGDRQPDAAAQSGQAAGAADGQPSGAVISGKSPQRTKVMMHHTEQFAKVHLHSAPPGQVTLLSPPYPTAVIAASLTF